MGRRASTGSSYDVGEQPAGSRGAFTRGHFVTEVIDALLDYRALLVDFNELDRPGGPAA